MDAPRHAARAASLRAASLRAASLRAASLRAASLRACGPAERREWAISRAISRTIARAISRAVSRAISRLRASCPAERGIMAKRHWHPPPGRDRPPQMAAAAGGCLGRAARLGEGGLPLARRCLVIGMLICILPRVYRYRYMYMHMHTHTCACAWRMRTCHPRETKERLKRDSLMTAV